jgi:hypothetical protein
LQVIIRTLKNIPKSVADDTLDFCMKNHNYSGQDFESVAFVLWGTNSSKTEIRDIKLMDKNNLNKVNEKPETSDIHQYQDIINN